MKLQFLAQLEEACSYFLNLCPQFVGFLHGLSGWVTLDNVFRSCQPCAAVEEVNVYAQKLHKNGSIAQNTDNIFPKTLNLKLPLVTWGTSCVGMV